MFRAGQHQAVNNTRYVVRSGEKKSATLAGGQPRCRGRLHVGLFVRYTWYAVGVLHAYMGTVVLAASRACVCTKQYRQHFTSALVSEVEPSDGIARCDFSRSNISSRLSCKYTALCSEDIGNVEIN